jgi:two-component system, NarL family, nitrate/nitrite response regulator NarL
LSKALRLEQNFTKREKMSSPADASPIRILLIAEHTLFRESLVRVVDADPDFEISAHCGSFAEALAILAQISVDVIVADLALAEPSADRSIDAFIASARALAPASKVLVIAVANDVSGCLLALRAGALGIVSKANSPELFLRAIRLINSGSAWLDRMMIQWLTEGRPEGHPKGFDVALHPLERDVLSGVCEGLTNNAIAVKTGIPEGTVKAVLRRLFQQTGARTRSQLVRKTLTATTGPGTEPKSG